MMKLTTLCINLYWKSRSSLWKSQKFIRFSKHPILRPSKFCPSLTLCTTRFVGFHTSAFSNAKSHQERENEYAHSVMENIQTYRNSLVKFQSTDKRFPHSSNCSKELSEFEEVTYNALPQGLNLENRQFNSLINNISRVLPNVSDDDIISFLQYLCLWSPSPKSYSPNFKLLWNSLDYQCIQRYSSWDLNRKLKVADYWFCLRLNRISQYNQTLIISLLQNLDSLSDSNVVQLMFLVNLQRKVPEKYMRPLEKKLLTIIKSSTIEEIGVICLGFFKTENKVRDFNIIKAIINRYCREVKKVEPLTINAILKFLKKSMQLSETVFYIPLLHKSISYVPNWDIPTSIQLALLSAECHVYEPLLLSAVTEKVADNIEDARVKDCVKLLQCLSHFNHVPEPNFIEKFLLELKKESRYGEIEVYPRDLAYTALYYSYIGHYNYKILSTVLEPEFVDFCISTNPEVKYSFAEIDYCVEIECKDYNGPRLSKEALHVLANRRGNLPSDSEKESKVILNMNSVLKSLEDLLGGSENILVRHVLPHCFSPDVIVRLSSEKAEPMSSLYGSFPTELILKPPQDESWACFVVSSPFSFAYKSRHLVGMAAMKLRQLEKLGYKTVFIPFQDLPLSDLMRKKYLKDMLNSLQMSTASKAFVKI